MIRKAKVLLEVEMSLDLESPVYGIPEYADLPKDFEPLLEDLWIGAGSSNNPNAAYVLRDYEALEIGSVKVIRVTGHDHKS